MKNLKKIIAIVLACIMAFSALQISAIAAPAHEDSIVFAIKSLDAAGGGSTVAGILIGVLYAFIPILIVVDIISYIASGNAIIAGGLMKALK